MTAKRTISADRLVITDLMSELVIVVYETCK